MRDGSRWLCVLALLWVAQLAWLYWRLGRPGWSEYWQLRAVYRPGIQAVDATGGDHLPGYLLNPLSPTGAKWAFILASGAYALLATCALWAIWRASEKRRRRVNRSLRRAIA